MSSTSTATATSAMRTETTRQRRKTSVLVVKRPRSVSQPCHPLSRSSPAQSPLPVLASLRFLVLSHLSELERRVLSVEMPSSEALVSKGEAKVEEAVEMLRRIRSEVKSHLPDLPFDVHNLEDLLANHFADVSYQSLLDDIRAHLPDIRPSIPEFSLSEMQSRIQDVRSHIHDMSVDLSQPLSYLPVLSRHLESLHLHLSSMDSCIGCSFSALPTTTTLSQLLDKFLSSNLVPSVLHRVDGHASPFEKAAKDMSNTLKKSLNGSKLVTYTDLPGEWRNNPWVVSGYRFIPLHRWPIILLSLFALHNETLNIHTHMIPLLHTALRFAFSPFVPVDWPETVYTLFAMLCLFSSVVWHTMSGCAHQVSMELCARVDYVGIGWLISASVGTVVYYGLSCHPDAASIYLSLCLVTGILGSIFPLMPWFNDRKYKPVRVFFFLGMAFTGLAPMAHLSYLFGARDVYQFMGHIAPSLASYIIGLIFYVSHVPERFIYTERIARWTDWLGGGSHAIWHAFIVLAIYQHKWGMRTMRDGVGGVSCLA